jgi:excisionase family DNA binding protein
LVVFVIVADRDQDEVALRSASQVPLRSQTVALADAPSAELLELLPKAFYSPGEVAELMSLSSSTILNYIHDGRLAAVRLTERTYRIPRKSVIRLLGLEAPKPIVVEDPSRLVSF